MIASWLLDLTATALQEDPAFRDSRPYLIREGRWTIKAAIDEANGPRFDLGSV